MTENSDKVEHVVLYGSLRFGQSSFQDLNLEKFLKKIGDTQFSGSLIDLGSYPGLILSVSGTVRGEIYQILDRSIIPILDEFERYNPADLRPLNRSQDTGSLYCRRIINTVDGMSAYVYEFNGEVVEEKLRSGPLVPSGDWIQHINERISRSS